MRREIDPEERRRVHMFFGFGLAAFFAVVTMIGPRDGVEFGWERWLFWVFPALCAAYGFGQLRTKPPER